MKRQVGVKGIGRRIADGFRNQKVLKHGRLFAIAMAMVFAVGACSDDDDNGVAPMVEMAALRALHLSPDAPGVDIFLNEAAGPAVEDLAFPEGTGFLEVSAGVYKIDIAASGSSWEDAVLSVPGLEFEKDGSYTAVAFNTLGSIQALALAEDLSAPMAGTFRTRAIHAAAGVGTVDIWNVTDEQNPAPLYVDFAFGDVGTYLELPAAAYSLGFDVDDDAVPDLVFELPALAAGVIANLFAVNDNGGAVFLLAQFADGSTARIDPAKSASPSPAGPRKKTSSVHEVDTGDPAES
jgi:hypothetical protein